jgi:hypothetical protein
MWAPMGNRGTRQKTLGSNGHRDEGPSGTTPSPTLHGPLPTHSVRPFSTLSKTLEPLSLPSDRVAPAIRATQVDPPDLCLVLLGCHGTSLPEIPLSPYTASWPGLCIGDGSFRTHSRPYLPVTKASESRAFDVAQDNTQIRT